MKIIKQGLPKEEVERIAKATKQFTCKRCGCIFEADKYYVCPNCKSDVQEAM
jgi:rubrerythrin